MGKSKYEKDKKENKNLLRYYVADNSSLKVDIISPVEDRDRDAWDVNFHAPGDTSLEVRHKGQPGASPLLPSK